VVTTGTGSNRYWPTRVRSGVVGLGLALAVAGCSAAPSATSHPSTALKPKSGGTVVVALGPLTGIDWYLPLMAVAYNSTTNATAQAMEYKGLYVTGANGLPDYARSIASSITWNKAGTVFTVKMNPKWHWSNGLPVTAQDVQFNWQMIQAASSPTAPAPWPWTGAGPDSLPTLVKQFTVVNAHEFQVTTIHPVNQLWFEGLLGDFTPFPRAAWDKYPNDPAKELAYLTSNGSNPNFFTVIDGPFRLVKAVPEEAWTYVPNPRYSGHKPYLSRLVFQYETSDTAEVSALQTGAVQVGYLPASDFALRNQLPLDRFVATPAGAIGRTLLNFRNPQVGAILRQLPVREAMQMGIDQHTIIRVIDDGLGVYDAGPTVSTSPWLDPALKKPVYPYDPAEGVKLLEANGWHLVNGVMTNARGQRLSFVMTYPTGSTSILAMVQLMKQDWAREGIQVTLEGLPFPTMLQYHREPDKWQIQTGLELTGGIGYQVDESVFATNGPLNFIGYSNPQLDRIMADALLPQPSLQAARSAIYAYQEFIAHHLPNLWMPVGDSFQEIAKDVHGVLSSVPVKGSFAIYPQYWWVGN
jgi:peptide/nickel transport system substrate-binding protein